MNRLNGRKEYPRTPESGTLEREPQVLAHQVADPVRVTIAPDECGICGPRRPRRAWDTQSSALWTGSGLSILGALKEPRTPSPGSSPIKTTTYTAVCANRCQPGVWTPWRSLLVDTEVPGGVFPPSRREKRHLAGSARPVAGPGSRQAVSLRPIASGGRPRAAQASDRRRSNTSGALPRRDRFGSPRCRVG